MSQIVFDRAKIDQIVRHMSGMKSTKIIVLVATLAALLVAADAQQAQNTNQTQNPPAQQTQQAQPAQQGQPAQQAAPAQPQAKKSIWQKLKDAQQAGQNIMEEVAESAL